MLIVKKFMPKQTLRRSTLGKERYSCNEPVFSRNVSTIVTECIVGIIMEKAYFLSVNELSMRYVKPIALGKMVCWN